MQKGPIFGPNPTTLEVILKYFPDISPQQRDKFAALMPLYTAWNSKINVISRKDMEHFYERHVLHSLALAKVLPAEGWQRVLDLGTGGGFPGIPLAIFYPGIQFTLTDSIRKKTVVAGDVAKAIGLKNATVVWGRAETIPGPFDAVVTRAVAPAEQLIQWSAGRTKKIFALKGGDLSEECAAITRGRYRLHPISGFFQESFFETKQVLEWTK